MKRSRKQDRRKIFCVGWHKTGTTSIGDALITLGYSIVGCRLDTIHPLREGNISAVVEIAGQFDAVQDVPWAALYQELDKEYPGSRFILTERDEMSWLKSASKHFGTKHIPLHDWLYGESVLVGNEELYLDRYRSHNTQVKKYFSRRPQDLLVIDFHRGDGWEEICKFLKQPVPKQSFPHSNKGPQSFNYADKTKLQIRRILPSKIRKHIFAIRQGFKKLAGIPDPRNRFNNMVENRSERKSWTQD